MEQDRKASCGMRYYSMHTVHWWSYSYMVLTSAYRLLWHFCAAARYRSRMLIRTPAMSSILSSSESVSSVHTVVLGVGVSTCEYTRFLSFLFVSNCWSNRSFVEQFVATQMSACATLLLLKVKRRMMRSGWSTHRLLDWLL